MDYVKVYTTLPYTNYRLYSLVLFLQSFVVFKFYLLFSFFVEIPHTARPNNSVRDQLFYVNKTGGQRTQKSQDDANCGTNFWLQMILGYINYFDHKLASIS